ncbi:MAG TPA: S53 family serine peptidase [Actinomycetota bacterium]
MSGRRIAFGLVAALLVAGVACSPGGADRGVGTGSTVATGGSSGDGLAPGVRPGTKPRRFVGATDRGKVMNFSVVLRLAHRRAMQAFLDAVNDPSSPEYRHFLTAAEFGRRFGLPAGEVDRIRNTLVGAGFAVNSVFPQRTSMSLRGTVGSIDDFFSTRIGDFRDTDGRPYVAPLDPPIVPSSLEPSVTGVAGLNGAPAPLPLAIPRGEGLFPQDAAKAYDITPLQQQGIDGKGQTIAVVSFASFRDQDVNAFVHHVGLNAPPVAQAIEHVPVDGGNNDKTGDTSVEVNLDLDVVHGMAPQAKILNYEAPFTSLSSFVQGLGDAVNQVVSDGRTNIVSISYGLCDATALEDGTPFLSPADRRATEQDFAAARAAGVSIFVAAGDSGAFGCQRFDLNDTRVIPLWPGDSPNVISVGGTLLNVRKDGTYLEETGWEDVLSQGGTGGGVNPEDPAPDFQQGDLTVNGQKVPILDPQRNPQGHRQGPDVAASADPDSGFFTVHAVKGGNSVGEPIGGTSAATPFWAATTLLIQQFAEQQGVGKLPSVAPLLYRIAAQKMNYDGVDSPDEPFHDVILGGNRKDQCRVGWDFATGLGSPNAAVLATDVVEALKLGQPSG